MESSDFSKYKTKDRASLVYLIQIAEAAERYEDMCTFLRLLVLQGHDLSTEERNHLSIAYKHVITALRSSWRTLNNPEGKYDDLLGDYKKLIEKELEAKCKDALDLLENYLLKKHTSSHANQVAYLKMAGDYYRYESEFMPGKSLDQKSLTYYIQEIGRAVQQECRDRSRMPSSA
eukprot:TRINITY_DN1636_c0_g1_i10.p1 TRINITY_DN1636_c0_g1~~TRINITY_DN1636_c0_g1_i10.p1  ORF type:complete len:175 (-),score=29.94 TRINITY_DN1636_c0_g1_i10:19-543(-)